MEVFYLVEKKLKMVYLQHIEGEKPKSKSKTYKKINVDVEDSVLKNLADGLAGFSELDNDRNIVIVEREI